MSTAMNSSNDLETLGKVVDSCSPIGVVIDHDNIESVLSDTFMDILLYLPGLLALSFELYKQHSPMVQVEVVGPTYSPPHY